MGDVIEMAMQIAPASPGGFGSESEAETLHPEPIDSDGAESIWLESVHAGPPSPFTSSDDEDEQSADSDEVDVVNCVGEARVVQHSFLDEDPSAGQNVEMISSGMQTDPQLGRNQPDPDRDTELTDVRIAKRKWSEWIGKHLSPTMPFPLLCDINKAAKRAVEVQGKINQLETRWAGNPSFEEHQREAMLKISGNFVKFQSSWVEKQAQKIIAQDKKRKAVAQEVFTEEARLLVVKNANSTCEALANRIFQTASKRHVDIMKSIPAEKKQEEEKKKDDTDDESEVAAMDVDM